MASVQGGLANCVGLFSAAGSSSPSRTKPPGHRACFCPAQGRPHCLSGERDFSPGCPIRLWLLSPFLFPFVFLLPDGKRPVRQEGGAFRRTHAHTRKPQTRPETHLGLWSA